MAYMDEMALEREKSRQAMLAGKQPLMGADSTAALHTLGVNLGIVPPNTPPSQMTQLLADLIKAPGKVKVDEAHPLQMPQQQPGRVMASLQPPGAQDSSVGDAIANAFKGAKDSSLQRMLRDQQAVKPPVGPNLPERPTGPGSNRARLGGRIDRSPEGATYKADLAFLQERGGHHSVLQDGKVVSVPLTQAGKYDTLEPELAARLRAAGEAFEKANPGKKAQYGEFSRGEDVQGVYYDKYKADGKSIAAPPGHSGHQKGVSGDLPDGEFRQWLKAGNQDQFGLHFPVKGDAPHVEASRGFKGPSFSNPPPAASAASAPSASGPSGPTGSRTLIEQRRPVANFFDKNPTAKDQMAAAAYTEDNNSPEGRIAVHEAGANRIIANGRPVTDIIDPKYYQAMNDPAMKPKYDAALKKIQTDPEFRKMLHAEIDQAHKGGTNYSNLATDFGSGNTAAKSKTNSTQTAQVGGNTFFVKDKTPEIHGAGTVANNQKWRASTDAEVKKDQGAKPTAPAQPSPQPAPQASAQPAPQAKAEPAQAAAPAASTPAPTPPGAAQLAATPAEPLEPESPQPSPQPAPAVQPPVAAVAAAPVPPPAPTPAAPVAKPAPPAAPPVNPAHAALDTKIIDLVRRGDPSKVSQIPSIIGDKTLREALNMPFIGNQVADGVKPYLPKMGITQQQFDQAVREGPPKPGALGKRSDLGTSGATDFSASKRLAPAADPNAATLDPASQPAVQNDDGSISTVRTIGVEDNGKEVNIPTVPAEGGRIMSDADARQRYLETGKHLGKFDTVEQAGAAAEELHQNEAKQIDPREKGPQPSVTPEMAKALENAFKDESRAPIDPPNPAAQPVLPPEPLGGMPGAPGAPGGGLSLAPAGLSSIPTGTLAPGAAPSQGGSIAMAGMLPPIQNATFSSPLLDQTAASSGSGMGLSPIPLQTLNGWGWGGGNIGAGLDWGGGGIDFGGGGFSTPMGGTGGW